MTVGGTFSANVEGVFGGETGGARALEATASNTREIVNLLKRGRPLVFQN